jgi:hypothetical protein
MFILENSGRTCEKHSSAAILKLLSYDTFDVYGTGKCLHTSAISQCIFLIQDEKLNVQHLLSTQSQWKDVNTRGVPVFDYSCRDPLEGDA